MINIFAFLLISFFSVYSQDNDIYVNFTIPDTVLENSIKTINDENIYIDIGQANARSNEYFLPAFVFSISDTVRPEIEIISLKYKKVSSKKPAFINLIEPWIKVGKDTLITVNGGIKKNFYAWEIKISPFKIEDDGLYIADIRMRIKMNSSVKFIDTEESLMITDTLFYRKNISIKKANEDNRLFAKIKVYEDGMYVVNVEDLKDIGIVFGKTPSSYISIYERGDYFLYNPPDTLYTNPGNPIKCYVDDGGDGILNREDKIYFFAKGPYNEKGTKFEGLVLKQNPYSPYRSYFITLEQNDRFLNYGKTFDYCEDSVALFSHYFDKDSINVEKCGLLWIEGMISPNMNGEYKTDVYLPPFIRDTIIAEFDIYSQDADEDYISIFLNDNRIIDTVMNIYAGNNARIKTFINPSFIKYGVNNVKITNDEKGDTLFYNKSYFSYYARILADTMIAFKYEIKDTDVVNIKSASLDTAWIFNEDLSTLLFFRKDVNVCVYGTFYTGVGIRHIRDIEIINRNILTKGLDKYDYWMIGPDSWKWAVYPLLQYRKSEGLNSVYISIEDIYNTFSGGQKDPGAIKYLLKYYYANGFMPKYVVLVGDVSYDYRNIENKNPPSDIVPTYESGDQVYLTALPVSNESSDWWFTMVTEDNLPDIPIGRLPGNYPNTVFEIVKKIVSNERKRGFNQNVVVAMPDDEYASRISHSYAQYYHTQEMEDALKVLSPLYELKKLYLMDYWGDLQQYEDWNDNPGYKPEVTKRIKELMKEGIGALFYIGHSSEYSVAHEHVFEYPRDVYSMTNYNGYYPFFFIGGCTSGFFDLTYPSISEAMVMIPDAGFGAIYSSTRGTGSINNATILKNIMFNMSDERRLGDILLAAYSSISHNNIYVLFGDPAMHLSFENKGDVYYDLNADTLRLFANDLLSGKYVFSLHKPMYLDSHDYEHNEGEDDYIYYWKYGDRAIQKEFYLSSGNLDTFFIIPQSVSSGTLRVQLFYKDSLYQVFEDTIVFNGVHTIQDTIKPQLDLFVNGKPYKENMNVYGDVVFSGYLQDNTEVYSGREEEKGFLLYSNYAEENPFYMYPYEQIISDTVITFNYNMGEISGKTWEGTFVYEDANGNTDSLLCKLQSKEDVITDLLGYYDSNTKKLYIGFYASLPVTVTYRIIDRYGRVIYNSNPYFLNNGYNRIIYNRNIPEGFYTIELYVQNVTKHYYRTKVFMGGE